MPTIEPQKKPEIETGLPVIPEQADQNAVREAIRTDTEMRSSQVLELGNAMPQIGAAQTDFLAQINSKTPDEKLIKVGTKRIADNTIRLMELAHEGQKAKLVALTGEQNVAAEKWLRDQEVVKAERAKAASNKWLSWIGPLGKGAGEAVGGLISGIIYSIKERRAESLARRNRLQN